MITEWWRPVPGFPDYRVSSDGKVWSRPRSRGKGGLLKQAIDAKGRPVVGLCCRGKQTNRKVSTLVAEAFIGPRPPGQVVRHLNDMPTDNRLSNLAYGTYSENRYDAVRNGTHAYSKRTHCKSGHEFTPENTYIAPKQPTVRYCRKCRARRSKKGTAA